MLLKLFLAFTLIPVLEIYLLIKVGTYLGAFETVMIVIITGFLGAYLARVQGLQTMMKVKESLNRGDAAFPFSTIIAARRFITAETRPPRIIPISMNTR